MKDTFQWTPELLADFFNSTKILPVDLANGMEQFKSSKAPKKEWEILAYYFKPQLSSNNKRIVVELDSHHWNNAEADDGETFDIHAVRRLPDGHVFTYDEVVRTPAHGDHHIAGFGFDSHKDLIVYFSIGHIPLRNISKLPSPLFVTTDGKGLGEGDRFYHVNEDWRISEFTISSKWVDYSDGAKNDFSTREAAETYILNNRPLLSLNDVKEICQHSDQAKALAELTALVKQKLNP